MTDAELEAVYHTAWTASFDRHGDFIHAGRAGRAAIADVAHRDGYAQGLNHEPRISPIERTTPA